MVILGPLNECQYNGELDLKYVLSTTSVLKMADHSKIKPMGIIDNINIVIAKIMYKIDYIIFHL